MKKVSLIITLLLISLTGCEKQLDVDPIYIHIDNKAGSVTFSIRSNIAWTIEVDATWLTVNPSSGTDDALVSLTYSENTDFTPRDAVITVKGGNSGQSTINLTQDATNGYKIEWDQKADMPTARNFTSPNACIVDRLIYVIGGGSGDGGVQDVVEAYDPISDTWSTKAPLNKARWGHIAEAVKGKIYVMGGCLTTVGEASSDIEVYDPQSDSWSSIGDMPSVRLGFGSCVVNDKIYVMGGRVAEPGGESLTSVYRYDPSTGEWISLSPMPAAKLYFSATAIDQTIYAISGSLIGGKGAATTSVFKYDVDNNSWSEGPNLNEGRWGIVSCSLDSLIVCAGGYTSATASPKATVEIINTNNDLILETTDLIHGIAACSISQYNGKVYVFGGANNSPVVYGESSLVQVGAFALPE